LKENSLAKRYAAGLIKTLADETEYRLIKQELENFQELIDTIEPLRDGMRTMLFSNQQKKELLDAIRQKTAYQPKTYAFLLEVLSENRLMYLDTMLQMLEELWLKQNGVEKLKVFSAVPLTPALEKKLTENLEKTFKRKILLQTEIDTELIAGIKIQRGLVFYDFSLEGNLKKLKEAIIAGDSLDGIITESPAVEL